MVIKFEAKSTTFLGAKLQNVPRFRAQNCKTYHVSGRKIAKVPRFWAQNCKTYHVSGRKIAKRTTFLGAKLQKGAATLVMSVCLYVCQHGANRLLTDGFSWRLFWKSIEKSPFSLQSDKNKRYFTWRPVYIYDHWSYCSWFDVCWSFGVLQPATRIPLQTSHTETPTHIEPRTTRPIW